MFCLDIETIGCESNAVVLSIALVYFDEKEKNTWESLNENAIFVKLSAKEQIENYNRTIDKSTIEWWKKQSDLARDFSFTPKKSDLTAKQGIDILKQYIKEQSKTPEKELIWVRGSLDQMAVDSLCNIMGEERLFPYWNYRDVRTFICFNTDTGAKGYAQIDEDLYPGTWNREVVIKHNPVHDIVLDCLQIIYGK